MADHRVRLDDRELALVVAALRARAAGVSSDKTRLEITRLAERLAEATAGNPWLRFGWSVDDAPA